MISRGGSIKPISPFRGYKNKWLKRNFLLVSKDLWGVNCEMMSCHTRLYLLIIIKMDKRPFYWPFSLVRSSKYTSIISRFSIVHFQMNVVQSSVLPWFIPILTFLEKIPNHVSPCESMMDLKWFMDNKLIKSQYVKGNFIALKFLDLILRLQVNVIIRENPIKHLLKAATR